MADDTTEYTRVKSPAGAVTTVPVEIRDALIESGYQEAGRRSAAHGDQQQGREPRAERDAR